MPTGNDLYYQQLLQQLMPRQGLNLPQVALGTGLLGATMLGRDEPGYVTEARQNVRNLSSPTGFASGFTNTVNALKPQFDPLIQQQQNRSLDEISQRFTAAFPGTAGAQPQEFGAYGNYLRDQFQPAVQNFYGNMGLQGLNTQYQAASKILDSSKPDPFKEGLAALAGALILGGTSGTGTFGSGGFNLNSLLGQNGIGGLLGGNNNNGGGLLNGLLRPQQGAEGGSLGLLSQALGLTGSSANPALGSALTSSISSMIGAPVGAFEMLPGGTMGVLGQNGQLIATIGNNGNIVSQLNGQILGNVGQMGSTAGGTQAGLLSRLTGGGGLVDTGRMFAGQGLLGAPGFGSMQGLLSGAGAGFAGFGLGNWIGGQMPGAGLKSGASGVGAGAAVGFVLGGPIGAAIGALAGLGGGLLGSHNAEVKRDAAIHAVDLQAAGTNKDAIGSFWLETLGAAGVDTADYYNMVKSADPGSVDMLAGEGASRLINSINSKRTAQGQPTISSLDQVPGLRQGYIDYIMQNTRIESGGKATAPGDISQKANLLAQAGFKVEGNPGVLATADLTAQSFANPDQPTRAEADALIAQMRRKGYTGSIPSDFYSLPGAIMNQRATQILRGG